MESAPNIKSSSSSDDEHKSEEFHGKKSLLPAPEPSVIDKNEVPPSAIFPLHQFLIAVSRHGHQLHVK